jgi:CHAD domain-containing protein
MVMTFQEFWESARHMVEVVISRLPALILAIDSRKDRRRLLKSIKPVRKQAGKVRDMDVLVEFASRPRPAAEQDCSIRLLEYLGEQRAKHARKLQSVIQKQMPVLRKRLKRCSRLLDKTLQDAKGKRHVTKWSTEAAALALRLEAELRSWRALNRSNLHEFRLKVKELRYVLRMAAESDNRFVETLAEVKDTVGEWHDWETRAGTSKEVINHPGCEFIKQIRSIADRKFEIGLATARRLKRQELGANRKHRQGSHSGKSTLPVSALSSASALAA